MTFSAPFYPGAEVALACDDVSFCAIANILRQETGIILPAGNNSLVVSRLIKHLRKLQVSSFSDYVRWVEDPANEPDRAKMISSLTTNTTHFFREEYHFDYLAEHVIDDLKRIAGLGGRIRLWSAGCSSGEEVYSLAATLLYHWPEVVLADVRILATDISSDALFAAKEARYSREKLASVPTAIRSLMLQDASPSDDIVTMPEAIRKLVSVRYLNFMEPWPTKGPFHVIMCRNVAIYMDCVVQERIFTGLFDQLAPEGVLFIGHSERLPPELSKKVVLVDRTTFRRV
ncbi:CheR family methyltransferase [Loktanella salsilacus]|uniref:CheR family methyltransferase n=1 Tax=Loktanella salsilacus TaxID=195913 RepID=UPI003736A68A